MTGALLSQRFGFSGGLLPRPAARLKFFHANPFLFKQNSPHLLFLWVAKTNTKRALQMGRALPIKNKKARSSVGLGSLRIS